MSDGKFASVEDVTSRYEKAFPSDRDQWVALRIGDAEAELMGQVPSLRKPLEDIAADSVKAGDPGRLDRVTRLIADKVLSLFRDPQGVSELSRTMPDLTVSRTFTKDSTRGRVAFTDAELDSVRLHTRRSKFGTVTLDSWSTRSRYDCCD